MDSPLVAIVLLNWNGLGLTLECLESLKNCRWKNMLRIVVDNGSQEKPGRVIKERFPDVHVIENARNLGFAQGNNVGMRAAMKMGAEYILLLNNDTIVAPDFIEPLVSELAKNPEAGAVSPLILFADPPDMIWFAGGFPILMGIHGKRIYFRKNISAFPYSKPYEVKGLTGCALMLSRKTIEDVGYLDPVYFTYCEDTDYSHRMREMGRKMMVVPASRIWHKVSSSSGGANNPASLYLMGRGRVIYLRKYAPWHVWLLFFPFALLQMTIDFAKRGGIKGLRARFTGFLDGFKKRLRHNLL